MGILKNQKQRIIKTIAFILAVFLITINYNYILTPNKIVIGGMSGLALSVNGFTGLNRIIFLNVGTVILFIVSIIFLDKKSTFKALFGSVTFNILVSASLLLKDYIHINIESTFITILLASVLNGIGAGIIYRSGYNTGGSDIIIKILNKYLKISMGKSSTLTNIFIIGSGLFVFGPIKTIYGIFILIISNYITDFILLGIKDSKMCFIKSNSQKEIEEYLLNTMNIGMTEIKSKGGIKQTEKPVFLVIVPTDKYYKFKHSIKNIDEKAFMLTINCYSAVGGYKKQILPF